MPEDINEIEENIEKIKDAVEERDGEQPPPPPSEQRGRDQGVIDTPEDPSSQSREEAPPPKTRPPEPGQGAAAPDRTPPGKEGRQRIPEPPEERDIEVEKRQGGPLFIGVDRFNEAEQTLHDLVSLSRSLEDDVAELRKQMTDGDDVLSDITKNLAQVLDEIDDLSYVMTPRSKR